MQTLLPPSRLKPLEDVSPLTCLELRLNAIDLPHILASDSPFPSLIEKSRGLEFLIIAGGLPDGEDLPLFQPFPAILDLSAFSPLPLQHLTVDSPLLLVDPSISPHCAVLSSLTIGLTCQGDILAEFWNALKSAGVALKALKAPLLKESTDQFVSYLQSFVGLNTLGLSVVDDTPAIAEVLYEDMILYHRRTLVNLAIKASPQPWHLAGIKVVSKCPRLQQLGLGPVKSSVNWSIVCMVRAQCDVLIMTSFAHRSGLPSQVDEMDKQYVG